MFDAARFSGQGLEFGGSINLSGLLDQLDTNRLVSRK
jgi:hypothetical protein